MNGRIKNGVVRRSWIARHGPDTPGAGNERRPAARGDRKLGYVCLEQGNTVRHTFLLRTTRRPPYHELSNA